MASKNLVAKMTLVEFGNLIKSGVYNDFFFSTYSQNCMQDSAVFDMSFDKVSYMLCPNKVCFKGISGSLTLSGVREVRQYDYEEAPWLNTFGFVCVDYTDESIKEYRVTGSKKLQSNL